MTKPTENDIIQPIQENFKYMQETFYLIKTRYKYDTVLDENDTEIVEAKKRLQVYHSFLDKDIQTLETYGTKYKDLIQILKVYRHKVPLWI
jgi:DNA repair ATPase RecN